MNIKHKNTAPAARLAMLRVAFATSTSLSSIPAAFTTLVFVPLIEIMLLLFASIGVTGSAALEVIYASVLVAFGTSVLLGVVEEITRDRNIEVLQYVISGRLLHPGYWLSKVIVPLLSSFVVAAVSLVAVFALSGFAETELLCGAFAALPFACVSGAVVGVCASLLTLGGNDPYLVSNLLGGALGLATGTILPLSEYPLVFETFGRLLPFSWLIEGLRTENLLASLGMELLICGLWIAVAAASVRFVVRRLRSGKVRYLLW